MDADRTAALLSAMAGTTRLRVLRLLSDNPAGLGAGEIGRRLEVLQSSMSSQLRVLAQAGLVEVRREGRVLVYLIVRPAIADVVEELNDLTLPVGSDA